MNRSILLTLALPFLLTATFLPRTADAQGQNAVLAELYGRGVHAFYECRFDDARNYLSMAINNGSLDPRAYYFRGIVAWTLGSTYEAETDWQYGAELEARSGGVDPAVGRALTRFQGPGRLKLEEIRQKARLQAAATAAARAQIRYGEIQGAQPQPIMPPTPVAPPPAPPTDSDNPFGQGDQAARGEPKIESDDKLEDAMNPFDDDPSAGGARGDAGGADPFGGAGDMAPADDPFGPPSGDAGDPFGTPEPPPADDPFGAPAGDGGMDDPFGGDDPFGS